MMVWRTWELAIQPALPNSRSKSIDNRIRNRLTSHVTPPRNDRIVTTCRNRDPEIGVNGVNALSLHSNSLVPIEGEKSLPITAEHRYIKLVMKIESTSSRIIRKSPSTRRNMSNRRARETTPDNLKETTFPRSGAAT
jgi:hypothetical protein